MNSTLGEGTASIAKEKESRSSVFSVTRAGCGTYESKQGRREVRG